MNILCSMNNSTQSQIDISSYNQNTNECFQETSAILYKPSLHSQNSTQSQLQPKSKIITKFSHRLEELKRREANLSASNSLDPSQNLNFKKLSSSPQSRLQLLYFKSAVAIQRQARVWLAKRLVSKLQLEQFESQKSYLKQTLADLADCIRV